MADIADQVRNSSALKHALKYFTRAHVWLYQRTNGRLGATLLRYPAALITTTGRKSGAARTTATLYLRDGDRVVLRASFGGRDHDPAWYLNIEAHPEVDVQVRAERWRMRARDATAAERDRYWPALTEMYPPYRDYREAAHRPIPLVVCERIDG